MREKGYRPRGRNNWALAKNYPAKRAKKQKQRVSPITIKQDPVLLDMWHDFFSKFISKHSRHETNFLSLQHPPQQHARVSRRQTDRTYRVQSMLQQMADGCRCAMNLLPSQLVGVRWCPRLKPLSFFSRVSPTSVISSHTDSLPCFSCQQHGTICSQSRWQSHLLWFPQTRSSSRDARGLARLSKKQLRK